MVGLSSTSLRARVLGIPVIDLSMYDKPKLCELIVKACEEFGVFQVENHGVSREKISRAEKQAQDFFSKPSLEKQWAAAAPPTPFGYGCKNIGLNGDKGELEYILLEANPSSVSHRSKSISGQPENFSCDVNEYIQSVRNLTCEILQMVAQGMSIQDKSIFSKLIQDENNDSFFRMNHYPSTLNADNSTEDLNPLANLVDDHNPKTRIGFGEHTDPQILTILHSNDVHGLQILSRYGLWIPVSPDSDKFCVFVGDAFQALTNGRFESVRHRVLANSAKPRMSMMYFAAPSLKACISSAPQLVSFESPILYRPFIWGEFKRIVYSLRLADHRLDFFRNQSDV